MFEHSVDSQYLQKFMDNASSSLQILMDASRTSDLIRDCSPMHDVQITFGFHHLTLSLPESVIETFKVVLTLESVDEITWCDHSNETSLAVLSHVTIYM